MARTSDKKEEDKIRKSAESESDEGLGIRSTDAGISKDKNKNDYTSPISQPIRPKEYNRNPAYFLQDADLLSDIMLKSQKIVKVNNELSQKLFDNEKIIEDLGLYLEAFQKRIQQQQQSRKEMHVMKKKIAEMVATNMLFKKDLEILRNDLSEKNKYINLLKREFAKRKTPEQFSREKDEEINSMAQKLARSQDDIKILNDDLASKEKHLSFLKRAAVKKQAMFFHDEILSFKERIDSLEKDLRNSNIRIMQLINMISSIMRMRPEEAARMKDEYFALRNQLPIMIKQREKDVGEQEKLRKIVDTSAERLESLEAENQRLLKENSKLRSDIQYKDKEFKAGRAIMKSIPGLKLVLAERGKQAEQMTKVIEDKEEKIDSMVKEMQISKIALKAAVQTARKMISEKNAMSRRLGTLSMEVNDIGQKYDQEVGKAKMDYENRLRDSIFELKTVLEAFKTRAENAEKESLIIYKRAQTSEIQIREYRLKEEYYRQLILRLTQKQLEVESQMEVLKAKN